MRRNTSALESRIARVGLLATLVVAQASASSAFAAADSGDPALASAIVAAAESADFVGWAWQQVGVAGLGTLNDLAASFKAYGELNGTWSTLPAVGDALYYHPAAVHGTRDDHVAIVTTVNPDGTVDTIGGNELTKGGVVHQDLEVPAAVGSVVWMDGKSAVQVDGYAAPVPPPPPALPVLSVPTGPLDGTVTLTAVESDPSVDAIDFSVDGVRLGSGAEAGDAYAVDWDTTAVTNGIHTITVSVSNRAGMSSVAVAKVAVLNPDLDLDDLLPILSLLTHSPS